MKWLRIISCFQQESIRSVDEAAMTDGSKNISLGPSAIAPFDLDIVVCAKVNSYKLPTTSSTIADSTQHDLLQLEMKGTAGSFFSRLLSREEKTGNSSHIYYRAPHTGRVPFHWEAEPGKPKSACSYYKEEVFDHEIIPPLSPPPFLQAKSAASSGEFSRNRVGLLHKIHKYILQRKTQEKSKQTRPGNGKNSRARIYSDWQIYGAAEAEIEIDGESEFSHMISITPTE